MELTLDLSSSIGGCLPQISYMPLHVCGTACAFFLAMIVFDAVDS